MRLDLETELRYRTGERAGFLSKALVGEDGEVSEVVMTTASLIARQLRVPVQALSEGEGGVVYVDLSPDEVDELPDYSEERVPAVEGEWDMNVQASAIGEVFPASTY